MSFCTAPCQMIEFKVILAMTNGPPQEAFHIIGTTGSSSVWIKKRSRTFNFHKGHVVLVSVSSVRLGMSRSSPKHEKNNWKRRPIIIQQQVVLVLDKVWLWPRVSVVSSWRWASPCFGGRNGSAFGCLWPRAILWPCLLASHQVYRICCMSHAEWCWMYITVMISLYIYIYICYTVCIHPPN